MSQYRVDVNTYWTPWEHEVCQQCYNDNPNAIWLVKVGCFKPHQHGGTTTRVVIDHEHMDLVTIRAVSTQLWRRSKFKPCHFGDNCYRSSCWFPHSDHEVDLWNIKTRLVKGSARRLVSQLCEASLKSQSPSHVCRLCYEANPKALWLAWLTCTDTENHKHAGRVTVVVGGEKGSRGSDDRRLVKVKPPPSYITEIEGVKLCTGRDQCTTYCMSAHSEEEVLYWKWQVARKNIFERYSGFSRLNEEYEYPSEHSSMVSSIIAQKLTKRNYHSKHHKLIYLEEIESTRKIIAECDAEDAILMIEWSRENSEYKGYLQKLSYTAIDYAAYNRAEVRIAFKGRSQLYTTHVQDTPDYIKEALVLRAIPDNVKKTRPSLQHEYKVSVHFDIDHHHYKHQHKAIEDTNESTLDKIFPINVQQSRSGGAEMALVYTTESNVFKLDKEYQFEALKKILSCNLGAPYLLLGPFGTGKTYLLAATVEKLVKKRGSYTKVLVCTHRNRGADGIYKTLHFGGKMRREAARLVGGVDAADRLRLPPGTNIVIPCQEAMQYSVLVTTFGVAGNLLEWVSQGHFSHILIDEGAQCPESEALGALVLADKDTKVIIVGDNKQVGPKVRVLSERARDNGLGDSLLERLYSHYKEVNRGSLIKSHTSTLLTNYRCHPSILMLASSLFYECTLISQTNRETHPKAPYPLVFACTSTVQDVYCNCPPENDEEAKVLIDRLVDFILTWPNFLMEQKLIGVLASTKQQVACLRKHWQSNNAFITFEHRKKVKILPTYNIQGEEFSAVFLSTAEPTDSKGAPLNLFKSVCNEYVFNTVITRPQSLIVVAGNPFVLLKMSSHFEKDCWREYIRRCIQCQSLLPPPIHLPSEAKSLPETIGKVSEMVYLSESIQHAEDQVIDSDDIVERYISDLNDRHEYKLATRLIQSPSGDISWVSESSSKNSTRGGIVWCELDCEDFRKAVAKPLGSNQEEIKLNTAGVMGRRGTFHGSKVKVDILRKQVLFDEETEQAIANVNFGVSFPCRVDPKNPILFFPLDRRYPKFANLPMLRVKDTAGVICFDPDSINNTPKVSNFVPLEVAAKSLFIVKFLGWQSRFPYPLGVIVAVLPPGNSPYMGELVLRINNNITLAPCQMPAVTSPEARNHRQTCTLITGAFTVDPKDSPDRDDALTCKLVSTTDKGKVYEIGVHITNVQRYVPKDSELDKEARKRGCAVYRSESKCVSYMLPERLVRDRLSISEGKSSSTLSVIARYVIDKNNNVEEVRNSVQFHDSTIQCLLQLTYKEAHSILCTELKFQEDRSTNEKIARYNHKHPQFKIEDQLSVAWRIAMYIRQKRLGKEAAYSLPLDEPGKQKHPEAHCLIEELMVWANSQVAAKLLKAFPDQSILRVHDKPKEEEVDKLQQEHGGVLATSLGLRRYAPQTQSRTQEVQILRSTYQEIQHCLGRALVRNALHCVQFEQLHPQMAVANVGVHQLQSETSSPSRYIVSTADRKIYCHNALQCDQYTHFTSPIRRYIDIVVQRLLHAAIHRKPCPYSTTELNDICTEANEALKNSKGYKKDVRRLDLATNLRGISRTYVGFVQRITEDSEIELTFADPSLKDVHKRERLIPLKHLKALSLPSSRQRELSPGASPEPSPQAEESAMWQVKVASFKGTLTMFFSNPDIEVSQIDAGLSDNQRRCAEFSLFIPEGNVVSEHSALTEHRLSAKVLPFIHSVPQSAWDKLQNVVMSYDAISKRCDSDTIADYLLKVTGFHSQQNSNKIPTKANSPIPLLIYKLHRTLEVSEVLKIHMTASPLNYVLAPSTQLVEVGPELRICVQHNSNPAECFADRLVEDASKRRYSSMEEYFRCWEQVLLSEAVSESLSESELLIVKDVTLKWPKLEYECDSFGQVTYKLNIPPGEREVGVVMTLPDNFLKMSYEFFKFDTGDLLCIRYDVDQDGQQFGFTLHMVIHHKEIEHTKSSEGAQVIEKATFYLKFVGDTSNNISPEVARLLQQRENTGVTMQCEVQLLPLTLPFRRIYGCLHDLRLDMGISNIARKIALGEVRANTSHMSHRQSVVDILPKEERLVATSLWPFSSGIQSRKELNRFQKDAIKLSSSNNFTLIQGPPGTGKTVTGAHLAYVLARKLQRERLMPTSANSSSSPDDLKPCVMYCAPSNQAVNVVLDILTQEGCPVKDQLKILRVFSKTIEQEKYPGPKLHNAVFRKYTKSGSLDSKCEPRHRPYALHERIRRVNPQIAEMDAHFQQLHKEAKVASQAKRKEYYKLMSAVEGRVLRENIDIVLCTCNEASGSRIRKTLKPAYCIIDESAMSTEPESMVPIQRADHVVLIGDHQQLRPVIKNHTAEVKGLGTSLFERYAKTEEPHMLQIQYRMHPEICKLPSRLFYGEKLCTDPSVTSSRINTPAAHLKKFWPQGENKPFVFVNIEGREGSEHTGQRGKAKVGLESKYNKDEAKKIAHIAFVLVTTHRVAQTQIAALTPYSAQKEEIKKYLKDYGLSDIRVKTVTESQGSEYGIVLLSTVRSKPVRDISDGDQRKKADIGWIMKNIGFVTDKHQICVGITRCKYGLVIVGNRTLLSYDETWREIIAYYQRNDCVKHGRYFP